MKTNKLRNFIQEQIDTTESLESRVKNMSISEIASKIFSNWRPTVNYAAKPYLEAMLSLNTLEDKYILDSGASIVAYFMSNAGSYRTPAAKIFKKELNDRLKKYYKR